MPGWMGGTVGYHVDDGKIFERGCDELGREVGGKESTWNMTRPRQTRTHCCGHDVTSDASWMNKPARHEINVLFPCCANRETFVVVTKCLWKTQKHVLCLGHKFCVRNKCCARGQTGKHLCPQKCVLDCYDLYFKALLKFLLYPNTCIFSLKFHGLISSPKKRCGRRKKRPHDRKMWFKS